jgi:DNA replication and repair protein RecF
MTDRVWIERLTLTDFRNYARAAVQLDARPVVLTGENGSGKTNLLEAVSLLSAGQGLRGRSFGEIARKTGGESWSVAARVWSAEGLTEIATGLDPAAGGAGRIVRIAGKAQSGSGALADHVPVVWLTPAFDGLFTGPAAERRRFLDRLILALNPASRSAQGRFERAMRQRNRALEQGDTGSALLDGIERQMAEAAVSIAAARVEGVARLGDAIMRHAVADSPFPFALLALDGRVEEDVAQRPAVDVEDAYAQALRMGRRRDQAAGRTLEGPHRSDFLVTHGPKCEVAKLCSSGEQKALLLGLVLAQTRPVTASRSLAPLLLLDEIAAHLDERRRVALFGEIERMNVQVWMSGTDPELFAPMRQLAQFHSVNQGIISAE